MGKTIAEWTKFVKRIDTRTLLECELGLHSFMGVLGFSQAFKEVGLDTIKMIIRCELDKRNFKWGTLIFQSNPHCHNDKGVE